MARDAYTKSPQIEDKYVVRLPDGLRDEIKAAAEANGRSMNAEIVQRLQQADEPSRLRDEFAMQALNGILAGGFADTIPHDDPGGGQDAAVFAYQYADAMLAARKGEVL